MVHGPHAQFIWPMSVFEIDMLVLGNLFEVFGLILQALSFALKFFPWPVSVHAFCLTILTTYSCKPQRPPGAFSVLHAASLA